MQERRAPHQHVQVLRCHGDALKFARRHGHIYIYDGELYIVRLKIFEMKIMFQLTTYQNESLNFYPHCDPTHGRIIF